MDLIKVNKLSFINEHIFQGIYNFFFMHLAISFKKMQAQWF